MPAGDVTSLMAGVRAGDRVAVDQLFASLYAEFRQMARARLRRFGPLTLVETTMLVNETYLRLVKTGRLAVEDRVHFLAYAARVMRSIIVDLVRERVADRRGGGHAKLPLDTAIGDRMAEPENEILRVSEALDALAAIDPRLVEVVELRYFVGLKEAEIAAALGQSERTIRRLWEKARVLLRATLRDD